MSSVSSSLEWLFGDILKTRLIVLQEMVEKNTKNCEVSSEIMAYYRCCVSACHNDSRYPDKIVKHGHVEGELHWHYLPKNPKRRAEWTEQVSKGLESFLATDNKVVCSNHFQCRGPTFASPKPTLYLVQKKESLCLENKEL